MKANGVKRKIFNDAVDLLNGAGEMPAPEGGIQMLAIDSIRPFRNHPFRLYEGERLEDMVASIREHGILNPVIVWKHSDGYEMLAGHNRQNAEKLAGLTEVPAIVKTELTEKDAYVYVIETNVIQREFAELLPSEKAAMLAERLPLVAAVDLSYLSVKEQETVSELAGQGKIKLDANTAKCLKGMAGEVTEKRVLEHVKSRKQPPAGPSNFLRMFIEKDIQMLDKSYFNIVLTGEYDVTVQSKNTGHFW